MLLHQPCIITLERICILQMAYIYIAARAGWSPLGISARRYTQTKDDISLSSFKIVATAGNADLESFSGRSRCRSCRVFNRPHEWDRPFVSITRISFRVATRYIGHYTKRGCKNFVRDQIHVIISTLSLLDSTWTSRLTKIVAEFILAIFRVNLHAHVKKLNVQLYIWGRQLT